ncbi:DUF4253 domain-containing protein [Streptomyces azureus]|uniref:DUF4253 domain-containing protein n=1 Tax=Streptomyces azureus TaxID=146537 RepID=UPI001F1E5865|nr:DUF4253 domain-containing protein [Streptomyces azureus]
MDLPRPRRGPGRSPGTLDAPDAPNHTPFPGPESVSSRDHAGVLREWQTRYGAQICYLDSTAVLLPVESPPSDPWETARVAIELRSRPRRSVRAGTQAFRHRRDPRPRERARNPAFDLMACQ